MSKKDDRQDCNETSEYRFAGDYQAFVPYGVIQCDNQGRGRWFIPLGDCHTARGCLRCIDSLAIPLLFACTAGKEGRV